MATVALMDMASSVALNDLKKTRSNSQQTVAPGEVILLQGREICRGLDRIVVTLSPDPVPPPREMPDPELQFRLGGKVHERMPVKLTAPWRGQCLILRATKN